MRVLALDIETRPNLAHVWGLWNQNVGLNQLLEPVEIICWSAKWLGDHPRQIEFASVHHDGKERMIKRMHNLLTTADVVLHYNGKRFDIPHLNREFLLAGLTPPSPFQQIDLYQVVKKRFAFPSNKLAYVSKALGLEGKVQHEGHELWIKCMAGDKHAWKTMMEYNQQDVILLEQMYEKLLPWIPAHPSKALTDDGGCPGCGGQDLKPDGFSYTSLSKFRRYKCMSCGMWVKDGKRMDLADFRQVPL